MIRFAEQVSKNLIPTLNREISRMESLVEEKKYLTFDIDINHAIQELEAFDLNVVRFEEDARKYTHY